MEGLLQQKRRRPLSIVCVDRWKRIGIKKIYRNKKECPQGLAASKDEWKGNGKEKSRRTNLP
jgi:hypothetical protein